MLNKLLHHNPAEASEPAAGAGAPEITTDAGQSVPEGAAGSGEGNQPVEGEKSPEGGGENKPTVKSLTAKLEEQAKSLEDVTSKLGKQSKHVKTLRDLQEALAKDPEKILTVLAKRQGKEVFFQKPGDTAANINKLFSEASDEERGGLLSELFGQLKGELRSEFSSEIEAVYDQAKATEHPDWDDEPIVDTIAGMKTLVDTGKMTQRELQYYAAKGYLSADALEAAKAEGKAEYIAELQKKNQGELSPGAGGMAPSTVKEINFEDVASDLSGII